MVTVISPAAAAAAVAGSYGKALNRRCASGRRQQMAPEFITDENKFPDELWTSDQSVGVCNES